jgi:hypothetical protein
MDDVANLPGIKPIELVYVQRVRGLFLGVTTSTIASTRIADISSSCDGKSPCDWVLPQESMRTHANPCFDSPTNKNNHHRHLMLSQPGSGLSDCATHPSTHMYWNGLWADGIKAGASTKCGIQQWLIPPTASSICGSMHGRVRIYERRRRQHHVGTPLRHSTFPFHLSLSLASISLQCGIFHSIGYAKMTGSREEPPSPNMSQLSCKA